MVNLVWLTNIREVIKNKSNRLSQSTLNACHVVTLIMLNAAKNILAAGLAVLACGETVLAASVKQEPQLTKQLVAA